MWIAVGFGQFATVVEMTMVILSTTPLSFHTNRLDGIPDIMQISSWGILACNVSPWGVLSNLGMSGI